MEGDKERRGCGPVAGVDMVVISLPRLQFIPMNEFSDGLYRLFDNHCRGEFFLVLVRFVLPRTAVASRSHG